MSLLVTDELLESKYQQLVDIKRRKKEWLQKHRLYYYSPLPYQVPFHLSSAHTRLVFGTNRSGKTTAGAVESICFALGFRPWLLPDELKQVPIEELLANPASIPQECKTPVEPPVKVLIIEDDWDTADDILITGTLDRAGKLTHYLPKGALQRTPEKNSLGYYYQWPLTNGSLIRVDTEKSFVNDPGSFEGGVWDLVQYDEPKKRDLRVALKRGLVDRFGYETFTLTPLTEPWIKDEIYDKSGVNPEIESFFFNAEENPHISKEGWDSFVASLTEDEKEARAKGKWIHLQGLIYKEFIPRLYKDGGNIVEPISHEWIHHNATLYAAIDPHPRQPHAVLLLAADKHGRWILWDEIFSKCLIPDLKDLIESKLLFRDRKGIPNRLEVMRWLVDPLAYEEDPIDGHTWADEFIQLGFPVEKAPKRRGQGILDVRHAFKERKLLVASNCARTIHELQHYVYDDWKNQPSRNLKEKPVDRDDHMMENMYRLVLLQPEYVPQELKMQPIEGWNWCP